MREAKQLLDWYNKNKRDLPWRHTSDPYAILVSEIMLQQTQVDTVIPYYLRFMDRFKTLQDLAEASEDEIHLYWQGLGYYSRVRNLQQATKQMIENSDGHVPANKEALLSLKGIGPYTSHAVLAIAFNQPYFALDGNGLRIISRLYQIEENIALKKTQDHIQKLGQRFVENYPAGSINQAFMDLGATICKPKNPKCIVCPLRSFCKSFLNHYEKVLPINIKKVNKQTLTFITGIITYQDKLLLIKNDQTNLLASLYHCIQYQVDTPFYFQEQFLKDHQVSLKLNNYLGKVKHVFSHQTWLMHVYHFELDQEIDHLYTKKEIDLLPISTAHRKIIDLYEAFCKLESQ